MCALILWVKCENSRGDAWVALTYEDAYFTCVRMTYADACIRGRAFTYEHTDTGGDSTDMPVPPLTCLFLTGLYLSASPSLCLSASLPLLSALVRNLAVSAVSARKRAPLSASYIIYIYIYR